MDLHFSKVTTQAWVTIETKQSPEAYTARSQQYTALSVHLHCTCSVHSLHCTVPALLKGNFPLLCMLFRVVQNRTLVRLSYPITALDGSHCAPDKLGHPSRYRLAAGVTGEMCGAAVLHDA
jgi:hypothetical protein